MSVTVTPGGYRRVTTLARDGLSATVPSLASCALAADCETPRSKDRAGALTERTTPPQHPHRRRMSAGPPPAWMGGAQEAPSSAITAGKENASHQIGYEPQCSPSLVHRRPLQSIDVPEKAKVADQGAKRSTNAPNVDAIIQMLVCKEKLWERVEKGFEEFDNGSDGEFAGIDFVKCIRHVIEDVGIDAVMHHILPRHMCLGDRHGRRRFGKQECLMVCRDVLLLACGRFLSPEEQIAVHLRSLYEDIDADKDGMLSWRDLVDSAVVQRELPFLLDELRGEGKENVKMQFERFRDLLTNKASGLVTVWMMRDQFQAFARSRGKTHGVTSKSLISLAEVRELVQHHTPYLNADRVREALAVVGRGSNAGCLDCDGFLWHFADMSHYLQYQLAQIVGLGELKRKLAAYCRGAILDQKRCKIAHGEGRRFKPAQARHMIFRGNPGTGKTTIAKVVADALLKIGLLKRDNFVYVQRESLVGDTIGATAKLTKKKVKEATGGVLFVDEAYRLFPKGADAKDFGREAVDELMAAMLEEDAPLMIFAGYPKLMDGFLLANPGLRSRIPTTLEFDDYSWSELSMILDQLVAKNGFRLKEGVTLSQVADVLRRVTPAGAAGAMNGRMCELIFDGAKQILDARVSGWEDGDDTMRLFELSIDDVRHGCTTVPPPADVHLADPRLDLDSEEKDGEHSNDATEMRTWLQDRLGKLVGMEAFKEQIRCLQEGMELDRRRAWQGRKVHMGTPSHMIFAGNPGTGKTTAARLVSALLQRAGVLETRKLVEVHREAFIGRGVVGSAEASTLEIIESAQGGVLFIDEANQLQDNSVGQKVIETLMQHMLRPGAPVMIFAGYPEEMVKFEAANKGLASRIPYRFVFDDLNAGALASIFRGMVERSGFELAKDADDSNVEKAFLELAPCDVRARSNGRLCETVLKFAKERLDLACVSEGVVSSVLTIDHVREGILKASEWGSVSRDSP